jgi:hypothetical protein
VTETHLLASTINWENKFNSIPAWIITQGMIGLFLLFSVIPAFSQSDTIRLSIPDSILEKQHSPTKASIMSLCLPGLGQIYNRKIWKVPIIYAGFGVFTYFIVTNADQYSTFKGAYTASINHDSTSKYNYLTERYTSDDLLSARDYYRRNLEITCLLTIVWYILNVIDATVDAHLFTYNISKDISLKLDPVVVGPIYSRNFSSGLRIRLTF